MKKLTDNEIQQLLDEGRSSSPGDDRELKIYQALYSALRQEPKSGLSYGFAAKVTAEVRVLKEIRRSYKVYVGVFGIGLTLLALVYWGLSLSQQPYALLLLKYKWMILFGLAVMMTVRYLDHRLHYRAIFKRPFHHHLPDTEFEM